MNMIARPEIVSPAGNLEKLGIAAAYGADAVYFGGTGFNLRSQADNFSLPDIASAVDLCKGMGVKTIFLLNSFLHEMDIGAAREYIEEIRKFPFYAVMVSDPGMLMLLRDSGTGWRLHLSTQMSTLNHLSVRFWIDAGFHRIVLARETTLEEIRRIRELTDAEIEVFVHGALCISYSGRCLLSRYLTGRDANLGDCSHPCRWNYTLVEMKRPDNYLDIAEYSQEPAVRSSSGTEILSSMDLCLIDRIPEYAGAGITAFKIEGRMKSVYYTANTARIYRHAASLAGTDEFLRHLPFWRDELDLISHRPYTGNLFQEYGNIGKTSMPYVQKALYVGHISSPGNGRTSAFVKAVNPIHADETLDAIYPIKGRVLDHQCKVEEIRDRENNVVKAARPGETFLIRFDRELHEHGIFRRRLTAGS